MKSLIGHFGQNTLGTWPRLDALCNGKADTGTCIDCIMVGTRLQTSKGANMLSLGVGEAGALWFPLARGLRKIGLISWLLGQRIFAYSGILFDVFTAQFAVGA